MYNFIQSCLEGNSFLDEVDDFVEEWHKSDSKLQLHEYLGMTQEEYSFWLTNQDMLALIIAARRNGVHYSMLVMDEYQMAARAESTEKARRLKDWLISQGLL